MPGRSKFPSLNKSKARLYIKISVVTVSVATFLTGFYCWFWTYPNPETSVPDPSSVTIDQDQNSTSTRVLFLGDTAPADRAKKIVEKKGYTFPYKKTRKLLKAYDAVVLNFEAPITLSDSPSPLRPSFYTYKTKPAAAEALEEVGITAVSLANNHAKDYLNRGLSDTLGYLKENGISHFGAGMSESDARRGLILETNSGDIGLIAYMEDQTHWRLKNLSFALDIAGYSWPGVARLVKEDVAEDIKRMRSQCDIVIVVAHWGKNYKPITDSQKSLGKLLIDLGADAVIGHHSHEAQPIGIYKNRPIIYSLGNYAFDTPGRRTMRFGFGTALYFESSKIKKIEIIPLLTQNRLTKFQPRIPKGRHLEDFFEFLIPKSREQGAIITRQGNRGFLFLN